MLYMVELDFSRPQREAEWNAWYGEHLRMLLAMPGFRAVQRFKADAPAVSPYLAVYEVESPSVFTSEAYRARGGRTAPSEWAALMVDWHRNLFDGIDRAPAVPDDAVLLVVDGPAHSNRALSAGLSRLRCVGLDHTVDERGIAVCSAEQARALAAEADPARARIFRPLMPQTRN